MRLCNVYREPLAINILYSLLLDRPVETHISHQRMPSYDDHERFVRSKPYRFWFLIRVDGEFVGDLHVTELNEIGVFLFERCRGKGYGAQAVKLLMSRYRPLHAIPAKRVRRWLAHIAPKNDAGASFFRKLGFTLVEQTWQSAS